MQRADVTISSAAPRFSRRRPHGQRPQPHRAWRGLL
jgi:hypothetical protein